jgi:hypothetical protein
MLYLSHHECNWHERNRAATHHVCTAHSPPDCQLVLEIAICAVRPHTLLCFLYNRFVAEKLGFPMWAAVSVLHTVSPLGILEAHQFD